jgi:excisionase family DNA binding protein
MIEQNSENRIEPVVAVNGRQKSKRSKPATMSVDEIARTLKVGRLKAYRFLDKGVIPAIRLAPRGRWLISRAAFEAWLESAGNAPAA